jgi:prepilin-type N-terminal cleavage/methylation domain-containing protein
MNQNFKKMFQVSNLKHREDGFTLMEIMVSTLIFVVLSLAVMSLFNYTLKINRKTDALRQASQSLRGFVENLVKEVHNGQIDYGVESGKVLARINASCPVAPPGTVGANYDGNNVYSLAETKLGLIDTDGNRVCIYLSSDGKDIMMQKENISPAEKMNPENFIVQPNGLKFYIRPLSDPYSHDITGVYPNIQPSVTMLLNFKLVLPTGEEVPIFYQTTIDANKYDIPNHD